MIIDGEKFREAILEAVADCEMIKILDSATFRPKAVIDVIKETGISHCTAYRKINWMLQMGLLFTEKIDISADGKKFSIFRSTLRTIGIKYEYGTVAVDVEYNITVLGQET